MINIDLIAKNSKLAFKVVVLCYGNPSRGDDALAPLLYDHLVELFSIREDLLLVNDFQLQIEHIVDISQADLVLFIDAHSDCVAPFEFAPLQISNQLSHTSHALSPSDLLGFYQQSLGTLPPPAFILAIKGESFELGESLSASAQQNLTQAQTLVFQLLTDCQLSVWKSFTKK